MNIGVWKYIGEGYDNICLPCIEENLITLDMGDQIMTSDAYREGYICDLCGHRVMPDGSILRQAWIPA